MTKNDTVTKALKNQYCIFKNTIEPSQGTWVDCSLLFWACWMWTGLVSHAVHYTESSLPKFFQACGGQEVLASLYLQLGLLIIIILSRFFIKKIWEPNINKNKLPIQKIIPRSLLVFFICTPIIIFVNYISLHIIFKLNQLGIINYQPESQAIIQCFKNQKSSLPIAIMVINTIILGPIIEEFLFRGYLYRVLKKVISMKYAILISAIMFSWVHHHWTAFLPLWIMGIFLVYIYEYFGNIWISVGFHALFNLHTLIFLLLHGQ